MTVEQWFARMRIVLKAAEKMYQQMVQDHGTNDEDGNNPWVLFRLQDSLVDDINKGTPTDIDEVLPKQLYLEINHL